MAAALLVTLAVASETALAMQFRPTKIDDQGNVVIEALGEIVVGDAGRLRDVVLSLADTMPPGAKIFGLDLDSPGGNLLEAEKLVSAIRVMRAVVIVGPAGQCVSACFLLFAAGAVRIVTPDALIGVHSASESGHETLGSMAMTTAMARDAAALGTPSQIIDKMVQTSPGRTEWLTRDDLALMDVRVVNPEQSEPTAASRSPALSTAPPPARAPTSPYAPANPALALSLPSIAFQQGLADRQGWEQWFGSTAGDFHDGAAFWAEHRGDHKPASCSTSSDKVSDEWTAGCIAAKQRLAPPDARRKTEPDYRRGWNSL
jgi:hypothetical protein